MRDIGIVRILRAQSREVHDGAAVGPAQISIVLNGRRYSPPPAQPLPIGGAVLGCSCSWLALGQQLCSSHVALSASQKLVGRAWGLRTAERVRAQPVRRRRHGSVQRNGRVQAEQQRRSRGHGASRVAPPLDIANTERLELHGHTTYYPIPMGKIKRRPVVDTSRLSTLDARRRIGARWCSAVHAKKTS
eukprot:scaffold258339_cov40-Tisochrysis_lutea.AAC.4